MAVRMLCQLHRMTSQDSVFSFGDRLIRPLSSVVERVIPAADRNLHKVVRSIRAGVTLLFRRSTTRKPSSEGITLLFFHARFPARGQASSFKAFC
jgi:hypothetical protein